MISNAQGEEDKEENAEEKEKEEKKDEEEKEEEKEDTATLLEKMSKGPRCSGRLL